MLGPETRIPRGVDRLDVRLPGWQEKIDIARLDMSSAAPFTDRNY